MVARYKKHTQNFNGKHLKIRDVSGP